MLLFFIRNLLFSEGLEIIGVLAVVALVGFFLKPLRYLAFAGFLFCLFFFRNPERTCPEALQDSSVLICPSDGKVLSINQLENDPQFGHKVAIFLSPLDVHVNWLPSLGTIKEVTYHKGSFAMAFLPKSSELNERNDVLLETQTGKLILVRQIAGTIARTIVCWVKAGTIIDQTGTLFGMIKFGSRIEVFLPHDAVIDVTEGQRVYGGQTVLGKLQ